MELINIEMTKIVDLFQANRSAGQFYGPYIIKEVVDRYKFIGFPRTLEEISAEKVSFQHGIFDGCAVDLDVYRDGIVVSSKSPSEILDAFEKDLLTWIADLGVERFETQQINKIYESTIVVCTPAPILSMLERLAPLQDLLARLLNKTTNIDVKFEPIGFSLSPDLTTLATLKPSPFRFERRGQISFGKNYFYSVAPLPTTDHIKVLRELEKLASA